MSQYSLFHRQGRRIVSGLRCTQCDLANNPDLQTNCMEGTGNRNRPTYLFAGVSPGKDDDASGIPMVGRNGSLFRQLLSEAGFNLQDCFISNCLRCTLAGGSPKKAHWKACKHHFLRDLAQIQPQVVVAVGGPATTLLAGHSGVQRLRRKLLPLESNANFLVYPIRQPAQLFHQEGRNESIALRASMVDDLRFLKNLVGRNQIRRGADVVLDYRTARTAEDVDAFLEEMGQVPELAFDFETSSLFPTKGDRLVAVGFSWGEGIARAIPLDARGETSLRWWLDGYLQEELLPKLREFMRRKKLWGHNAIQFDQKWSRAFLDLEFLDIDYDTQFGHYVLDEERGTHGLEQLAVLHTNMEPWKSEFNLEDTAQLSGYLCKDCDATWRLRKVFEPQLTPRKQWLLHELIIPLAKELDRVEWQGVRVNEQGFEDLDKYIRGRVSEEYEKIRSDSAVRAFEVSKNRSFEVDKHADVREVMRDYLKLKQVKTTDGGEYSTDVEVLEHYSDSVPTVAGIAAIRRLNKLHGTYVTGLREAVIDGRLHTTYKVHGTVTGRPSSSNPNLMNIPRSDTAGKVLQDANAIKRCFRSEDGYLLLQADYSQAELRVMACMSGDPSLIDIYRKGLDAHTATAAKVYGASLEEVTKGQRSNAKTVNFGIIYGMSWEGVLKKFLAAGNTEAEAKSFYDGHKRTFPCIWAWMDEQERLIRRTGEQTTPFGRTRHYGEIDNRAVRQSYNFPIQSMASDLTLISLVRTAKVLRQRNLPARVCLTVYDSIVYEIRQDAFWEVCQLVHSMMAGIQFDWMQVPMEVDMEVGYTWGDLKSIDMKNLTISS